MTNFVNFITDKIRPSIVQAYLDGPGTEDDFIGSDSSTMDFTKFGYVAAVYRNMLRNGTADDDVKDVVKNIALYENPDGVVNFKMKSSSGFSIADMMVYDARNDPYFIASDIATAVGVDFMDFFIESVMQPVSNGMGNAIHMMIEFKLQKALLEMPSVVFVPDVDGDDMNDTIYPFMYALKRAADSGMEQSRMSIFNTIKGALSDMGYNDKLGKNNKSLSDVSITNEMAKFLISTSSDSIDVAATQLLSVFDGEPSGSDAMMAAVTKADGISKNSITFDIGVYDGELSGEHEEGYTPLFFYVNRFKSSSRIDTLEKLTGKFSLLTISTFEGETDGYNPASVLASSFTINSDGEWENSDLVSWFKGKISEPIISGTSAYKAFVALGNGRDCSGGKTNNAYGTVTNILRTVNSYHKEYNANKEEGDADFNPVPLISAALPDVFDAQFYDEWMVEFGQEVD